MSTAIATRSVLTDMATMYGMERAAFEATIKKTIMPAGVDVSNEELVSFLIAAREYNLNPFLKEIYAFPKKGGGIQPIVPVDGWGTIINRHPAFDGMDFVAVWGNASGTELASITCRIHRKDRTHPIEVTEYMTECRRDTETWRRWPIRMLRHKAMIQCARYAFGFGGIVDPDEAERMIDVGAISMPSQAEIATIDTKRILAQSLKDQLGSDPAAVMETVPVEAPANEP